MRLAFQNGQAYVPGKWHPVFRGIGDDTTDSTYNPASISSAAITGASTATMLGGSTSADVVGGIQAGLMAAAPLTGPAAPFISAIASLIGPIASLFKGCGATCTQTTQIANSVESATTQITNHYWAQPVRTVAMQQAAIAALQQLYSYLIQNCQKIGGRGGSQCVADRQPGGKYDYQAQQIAPIQNDTAVVPDPVVPGALSSIVSGLGLGSLPMPLILGGGLVLLLLLSTGGGK